MENHHHNEASFAKSVERLACWIAESQRTAVFTGAGISTESGIPDFRSPGGVWSKYDPVYYNDFCASSESRHEYWRQKAESHADFSAAQPNAGHRVLAEWERQGAIRGVITQNIDGLHQLAGSQDVLELHGTAREIACLDCAARYPSDPLVAEFLQTNRVPACAACGGRLKHATVSFGQSLPGAIFQQAAQWCRQCDLLLAIGSSLVVTPAANLPVEAKRHGARLVIINREPTPLDEMADLILRQPIGAVLNAVAEQL